MKVRASASRRRALPERCSYFKPYIPRAECVCLMGVAQSGKTTLLIEWIDYMVAHGVAVIVWDAKVQHSIHGKRRTPGGALGHLPHQLTVPQFHEVYRLDKRVITRADLKLCLTPSSPGLSAKERAEEFKSILAPIRGRGRCVFVIEEVGQLVKHAEAELNDIASVWPEDVSSIFSGQVPGMFTTWMRGNAMRCISGVQPKRSDRQTIGDDFGHDYAEQLQGLGLGEFLTTHTRPAWADNAK